MQKLPMPMRPDLFFQKLMKGGQANAEKVANAVANGEPVPPPEVPPEAAPAPAADPMDMFQKTANAMHQQMVEGLTKGLNQANAMAPWNVFPKMTKGGQTDLQQLFGPMQAMMAGGVTQASNVPLEGVAWAAGDPTTYKYLLSGGQWNPDWHAGRLVGKKSDKSLIY